LKLGVLSREVSGSGEGLRSCPKRKSVKSGWVGGAKNAGVRTGASDVVQEAGTELGAGAGKHSHGDFRMVLGSELVRRRKYKSNIDTVGWGLRSLSIH
jgi:hypothetical protein